MMLISGIVDLILAGLILAGLPGTAAWAIGLIVGVNLFFGGVALVALAFRREAAPRQGPLKRDLRSSRSAASWHRVSGFWRPLRAPHLPCQ